MEIGFAPAATIENIHSRFSELPGDAILKNCTIDKVKCAGNLLLTGCTVKSVSAKNLFLNHSSFTEAESAQDMWIVPKPADQIIISKTTVGGEVTYILPEAIKSLLYRNGSTKGDELIGAGITSVTFQDCEIGGNIIFRESENTSINKAILLGKTTFSGKTENCTLIDQRGLL
jgi:hypothetical protein